MTDNNTGQKTINMFLFRIFFYPAFTAVNICVIAEQDCNFFHLPPEKLHLFDIMESQLRTPRQTRWYNIAIMYEEFQRGP